ncbi:hypothetical protein ABIA30_004275 [Mycobacterium sp. MAA66]|uniref:hypothetical protein n=1 Tax=Mycobacterium sp. MAA66 TaxID=3156297 RepID=UPI0035125E15
MSGLRDQLRRALAEPVQPPVEPVQPPVPVAVQPVLPPVEPEPLPPGQRRVRVTLAEVLAARDVTGVGHVGGFARKLTESSDVDPRPSLARRAGFDGDVMFPRLDD